jgi:tetratricopeptide (TPR) repeat protein
MKFFKGFVRIGGIFGIMLFSGMFLLSENALASTISGTVYDKQRNQLSDVDVELLDDLYRQYKRTRTDSGGRYQFDGLSDGNWTVKVSPFRYDLVDQSQPIEIKTLTITGTANGNAFMLLDFYLLPKKGSLADSEIGVVFAQEVPAEAKKLYEKAMKEFSDKRVTEGILGLNKAIELFPNYYLALHRVGKELFALKKYQDAVPFFFKAAEVNPKSATSFYYLGYSLFNLGKDYNKAALAALNQSYTLAPASTQVLFVLGKVERAGGNFENAEKHLLQAKKLAKVSVPDIHKELAQLYANDMKKYTEAADELETYLKNNKPSEAEEKQMKKVISDLREKAKSQSSK